MASGATITYGIAPVANTAWRGDYMWLGGSAGGTTNHPIVITWHSWA